MIYRHLGLRDWPFRIVPEPEFCDFMADRTSLRKDVEELLCALETRPTSDIQLIWSWYGAGKTHTVYYLANQCSERHQRLTPIYTELPREAKGFADLYRGVVSQLPLESVIDGFLDFSTRPHGRATFARTFDPDLSAALTQAALGDRPLQVLLGQWLLGNTLPVASLRHLGVGGRISITEKCAIVLADLIALLAPRTTTSTAEPRRLIWIIDEVQRVEDLAAAAHRSILSGLVGVFNGAFSPAARHVRGFAPGAGREPGRRLRPPGPLVHQGDRTALRPVGEGPAATARGDRSTRLALKAPGRQTGGAA